MSEGVGYYLSVKHAVKDVWREVGPDPRRWGLFQIKESVEEMAALFKSLGLETKIQEFSVEYDDRG
jgi:hypothetical protein